ncbi:Sodium/hydrogen exchanger 2 [Acipenser ruthenus]|uniref:Sodium/hydrogen exchanger n=1 Tax=Acipenser ruthenus TaxID=7906 RepID=A0A662YWW0_ACIRT|nr:Sodium/hydrogen exchanger 2 [Acipenser ruthenus]
MYSVHEESPAVLTTDVFFLYLLPPIVLDAGYFMPTRLFFENCGTVLWFSVVGTLWNSIGIGISLFGICQIEAFGIQDINLQENLLFGTIISTVDPVAVLAVFEEININEQLYIVVFGESLYNDAITVALYSLFKYISQMDQVDSIDIFLGTADFFVVGFGGIMFGLLFGFVAAFTTRFTANTRELEPVFVFMYSYLAYLLAELFSLSSIMAIVTCALTMKYYVEENVSQRSCTTIRHFLKMWSSVSETLIFFFLGVTTVTSKHEWNWAYIGFTLIFCIVWRGLGVLVLAQIINNFRTIPFTFKDQFSMAYGGLRGAICFSLAFLLPDTFPRRNLFTTAAVAVIIFTVFIQGITIRPLIDYLNVRRTNRKLMTINVEIHSRAMEHTIAGIEDLCGQWSHYYWKDKFKKINDRFLRKVLIKDNRPQSSIVSLYKKLELQNALVLLDSNGGISGAPSLTSLQEQKPTKRETFLPEEVWSMQELLSKNMYKIRERTLTYTRHSLPNETRTKEILLRRHSTIRKSMRKAGTWQTPAAAKYYSLPPTVQNLQPRLRLRKYSLTGDDDGDDDIASEINFPPARPRLQLRAKEPRRALQPPRNKLETVNEVRTDSRRTPMVDYENRGGSAMSENSKGRGTGTKRALTPMRQFGLFNEQGLKNKEKEDQMEMEEFRQEALLAAISEKDANIALLELSSSKKKKTQDEVTSLKREKDRLVQQLKQQTQNRMKLMADNYEDDHLKSHSDQTNHKPSPDQIIPPLLDLNQNRSKLKLYIGHLTALCQDRDPKILQGIAPPTSYHHDDRAAWEEELQKMSLEQLEAELEKCEKESAELQEYANTVLQQIADHCPDILEQVVNALEESS